MSDTYYMESPLTPPPRPPKKIRFKSPPNISFKVSTHPLLIRGNNSKPPKRLTDITYSSMYEDLAIIKKRLFLFLRREKEK